jgi:hypothetical protein
MSYILKTAAMSLLSKTLQTFLYKYLSDVDVEGVALPSVYDGSGWGVRLSNVKLREGVQLMMAPGKVTKKRRRRRRRKKKKSKRTPPQRTTTTTTTTTNKGIPEAARSEATSQVTQVSREAFVTETRTGPARALDDHPTEEESELNGELNDGSLHLDDMRPIGPIDYNDDDGEEGSRPSTPIQDSKSFFSCFHNSRANLNNGHSKIPNLSLHGTEQSFPDVIIIDQKLEKEVPAERELRKDEVKDPAQEQEEEEEWEEYEEYEQAVKLCLGENGRIGTLDIR